MITGLPLSYSSCNIPTPAIIKVLITLECLTEVVWLFVGSSAHTGMHPHAQLWLCGAGGSLAIRSGFSKSSSHRKVHGIQSLLSLCLLFLLLPPDFFLVKEVIPAPFISDLESRYETNGVVSKRNNFELNSKGEKKNLWL